VLTDAPTNWNFEFARTAKVFNRKFTNRLKKCQRLLSTFADVCYFFIINALINVYYYFFGRLTHLCLDPPPYVTASTLPATELWRRLEAPSAARNRAAATRYRSTAAINAADGYGPTGMIRRPALFSELRRFIDLVRRGAGRWAELISDWLLQ